MSLLNMYIRDLQNNENFLNDRDRMFLGVIPMLIKESQKYISLVKTKDEFEDVENSLVEFCYKCIDTYSPDKGAKFSTYLSIRLMDFNNDFITKYYGVKTSRSQIRQYRKKYGEDLKLYFDVLDDIII